MDPTTDCEFEMKLRRIFWVAPGFLLLACIFACDDEPVKNGGDDSYVDEGTIMEIVPKLKSLKKIRFVLFSAGDLEIHEKALEMKT